MFKSILQGCVFLVAVVFFLFGLAKQFNQKGTPEHEIIGATMVIAMAIIVVILVIGK